MSSPLPDQTPSERRDPFIGLERPNLPAPTVTGLDEICATVDRDPDSRKADLELLLDGCSSKNVHASNTARKALTEYLPKLLAQEGSAEPAFTKALLPIYLKILALYPDCAEGTDLETRIVTYGRNLLEPLRSTNYPQDVLASETREELIQILKSDRAPGKSEILEELKSAATQASKPGPVSGAAFDFVAELAERVNSCLVLACYSQIQKEYVAQVAGFDDDFTKVVQERLTRKFGAQTSWPSSAQMTLATEYRKVAESPESSPTLRERAQRGLCNLLLAIGPKFGNDLNGIAEIAIDTSNPVSPLASQLILSRIFRTDNDRMLVYAIEAAGKILKDSNHPSSLAVCAGFLTLLHSQQSSEVAKALFDELKPLLLTASKHPGSPSVTRAYTEQVLENRDVIGELLPTLKDVIVKEPESQMGRAAWRYVKNLYDLTDYPNIYSKQRLAIYREILANHTHPFFEQAFSETLSLISDFNNGEAKGVLFEIAADSDHPLFKQAREKAYKLLWWGKVSSDVAQPLASLADDYDPAVRRKFGRQIAGLLSSAPGMKIAAPSVLAILSDKEHENYERTKEAFIKYLDNQRLTADWIAPALPTIVGLAISSYSPIRDYMRAELRRLTDHKRADVSAITIRSICGTLADKSAEYLALPGTEYTASQVSYVRDLAHEMLRTADLNREQSDSVVWTLLVNFEAAILDTKHDCNGILCEQIDKLYSPEDDKLDKTALPIFKEIITKPNHPLFTKAFSALATWACFKVDESAPRGIASHGDVGTLLLEALPTLENALQSSPEIQSVVLGAIAKQFRHYTLEPGWSKVNFELAVNFLEGVKNGAIQASPDAVATIYSEVRDTASRFDAWNKLSPREQERIIQVLK